MDVTNHHGFGLELFGIFADVLVGANLARGLPLVPASSDGALVDVQHASNVTVGELLDLEEPPQDLPLELGELLARHVAVGG